MSVSSSWKFATVFPNIPKKIREKLENTYTKIQRNFAEGHYETAELNAGKFCEAVIRLLQWHVSPTNDYTPFSTPIRDFGRETRKFEHETAFPYSIRCNIPKVLNALYDLRNNRGVAHTGGDVDPNLMDSTFIVYATAWVMADLVRIFHKVDTNTAQKIVASLVAKRIPLVWEVGGKKRVLDSSLSYKNKTLVILHRLHPDKVNEKELVEWVEHSNPSVYRGDILRKCHRVKLLEYDENEKTVIISPKGIKYVEENIPLTLHNH